MELFLFWLLCAILGAVLLSRYDKAGTGLLLGALLGPIGVLFALVMRSNESKKEEQKQHKEQLQVFSELRTLQAKGEASEPRLERECPYCAEKILVKAKICKHCGKDVDLSKAETPMEDRVALTSCPECGKEVSTKATACPHCGHPISTVNVSDNVPQPEPVKTQGVAFEVDEAKIAEVKNKEGTIRWDRVAVLAGVVGFFFLYGRELVLRDGSNERPSPTKTQTTTKAKAAESLANCDVAASIKTRMLFLEDASWEENASEDSMKFQFTNPSYYQLSLDNGNIKPLITAFADTDACIHKRARHIRFYDPSGSLIGTASPTGGISLITP